MIFQHTVTILLVNVDKSWQWEVIFARLPDAYTKTLHLADDKGQVSNMFSLQVN